MKAFVGVDLGGTNLRAGIVDIERGIVLTSDTVPTLAREGPEAVMRRMGDLVKAAIASCRLGVEDIGGVGIGVPGVLDLDKGLTLFLPNLPGTWPNVPLGSTISEKVDLPVFLLNDARSITYGEWMFGAGRGVDTMACFTIGTGIGGGLVINRKLHLGIGGTGGELGHQTIDFNGPVCGCGNRGCLEAFASGPAMAGLGIKAVIQGLTTSIGKLVDYDLNRITPEVICEAARQGDSIAKDIYVQAGTYIGIAVANILTTVGPRKVVIGGGVAAAGDLLLEPLRRTVHERVHVMPIDQTEIVQASLGLNAGLLGSAMWAAHNLDQV